MAAPGVVAPPSAKIDESLVHTDVMLFNRCSYDDVSIGDLSVEDNLTATADKHPTYMPHTDESLVHTDIMVFNRWSYDDVSIGDLSVEDYLNATAAKHPTYMSHTAGRYQARRYRKAQCPIVAIKKKDEIERVAKANR